MTSPHVLGTIRGLVAELWNHMNRGQISGFPDFSHLPEDCRQHGDSTELVHTRSAEVIRSKGME